MSEDKAKVSEAVDPKVVKTDIVKQEEFSDLFITEADTFDISLKYYKKDGQVYTDGTDENFSALERSKELILTLKYPDQSDCAQIGLSAPRLNSDADKIDLRDFMAMELSRVFVLVRKWSIGKELNRNNIMSLNPKVIKGILAKIRIKIGMDGII